MTVSSFYGEMTVTPDSVFYTTPAYEGAVSRDLVAVLTRPDFVTRPDRDASRRRSDPWPAETMESHLVFADFENGPLPAFPPLGGSGADGAAVDSLTDALAQSAAHAAQLEALADELLVDLDAAEQAQAEAEAEAVAALQAAATAQQAQAQAEASQAQAEAALADEIANRQALIDAAVATAVAEQTAAIQAELTTLRAERTAILAEVQRNNSRLSRIIQAILNR